MMDEPINNQFTSNWTMRR